MGWIARCQSSSAATWQAESAAELQDKKPSQLEINIISAQDVKKEKAINAGQMMQVYAVAWIKPSLKMRTQVVNSHDLHPTWNARLTFPVEEDLLNQESAAITVEIYCQGRFKDCLLGTVRVLLCNLTRRGRGFQGAQSLALQIRRPSGRPHGVLNLGSMLLDYDASLSMPALLRDLSFLDNYQPPAVKFSPFREIQEICRRSFSVNRDDLCREKPDKAFALDDCSLGNKHLCDSREEWEGTDPLTLSFEEEEESMEAIYRRLKSVSRGKVHREGESSEPIVKTMEMQDTELKVQDAHPKAFDQEGDDEHDKASIKAEDWVHNAGGCGKFNEKKNEARVLESKKLEVGGIYGCPRQPEGFDEFSDCQPLKLGLDESLFTWKVAPLQKLSKPVDDVLVVWSEVSHVQKVKPKNKHKKQSLSDEGISREDGWGNKPSGNRATWTKRASWALRKGAAKIHLSPSEKEIQEGDLSSD